MNKFTYREKYGLIIVCKDEKEQIEIYNRLNELGIKVKVVCV